MSRGSPSHLDFSVGSLDFSVGSPRDSIRFYDALLTCLGYDRIRPSASSSASDWQEPNPTSAAWAIRYADRSTFAIDLRPAEHAIHRRYDRREPGPHHLAFDVDSDAAVDAAYLALRAIGADILDPPAHDGGQPAYGDPYSAAFFADPDGFKLEVVHCIGLEA